MDLQPPSFLTRILAKYTSSTPQSRPFVTLTFAESKDAKIAGISGQQLILSGKESMLMTHWMRTMHDAILIGIGTALNDNPQLNTRHLPSSQSPRHLPRPIILDTHLRFSPTSKLVLNFQAGTGRRPWVICETSSESEHAKCKLALEDVGVRVFDVPTMTIPVILSKIRALSVQSIMIEGGAKIIQALFAADSVTPCIDTLIVTTSPRIVGEGVTYDVQLDYEKDMLGFQFEAIEKFGEDSVYAWSRQ